MQGFNGKNLNSFIFLEENHCYSHNSATVPSEGTHPSLYNKRREGACRSYNKNLFFDICK